MAREWTEPMHWDAEGTAPSTELQAEGFKAGYKPPASIFNYFLHRQGVCTEELQAALDEVERGRIVEAVSEDGVAYTATVPNVTELYVGLEITLIPNMTSASRTPTLNVNGLGAIRMAMPINGSNTIATTMPVVVYNDQTSEEDLESKKTVASKWLTSGKPVTVRYDGTIWETDIVAQSATNLYGKVPIESGGTGANNAQDALANLGLTPVSATSEDGISYIATVEGVTELYDGLEITIKPNTANTSNAMTLDVNGLGAKPIKRPLSFSTYVNTVADSGFLHANTPCRLMYHAAYPNRVNGVSGTGIWLMADKVRYSAQDLYGTTPIESGGTGATTEEGAREKLQVARAIEDTQHANCFYRISDEGEMTEWINPPMVLGEEYLTSERHSGAKVYAKLINTSALSYTVTNRYLIAVGANPISIDGVFVSSAGARKPLWKAQDISCSDGYLTLTIGSDLNGYTAYITVKYTK